MDDNEIGRIEFNDQVKDDLALRKTFNDLVNSLYMPRPSQSRELNIESWDDVLNEVVQCINYIQEFMWTIGDCVNAWVAISDEQMSHVCKNLTNDLRTYNKNLHWITIRNCARAAELFPRGDDRPTAYSPTTIITRVTGARTPEEAMRLLDEYDKKQVEAAECIDTPRIEVIEPFKWRKAKFVYERSTNILYLAPPPGAAVPQPICVFYPMSYEIEQYVISIFDAMNVEEIQTTQEYRPKLRLVGAIDEQDEEPR